LSSMKVNELGRGGGGRERDLTTTYKMNI
jgi:hypothetical protein